MSYLSVLPYAGIVNGITVNAQGKTMIRKHPSEWEQETEKERGKGSVR